MKYKLLRFSLLSMFAMLFGGFSLAAILEDSGASTEDVTATWSWKDGIPATIANVYFEGNNGTGDVDSDVEGIKMHVDATSGKLKSNGDNAQFNAGTKLQVPVKAAGDVVTVVAHPYNFEEIKVGGTVYTTQTIEYTATAADKGAGYVEIEATKNMYLYSVKVLQKAASETSTGFRDIKVNLTDQNWADKVSTGGAASTVYITVAEDGTIGTTENADEAAATLIGYWHGTTYGWQQFQASVPVEGCVKITYGMNDYGGDVIVTDATGTEVAKLNNKDATGKWTASNPDQRIAVTYYRTNEPTTLHFSKADYNPYFAVEAIDPADLPAETETATLTFDLGNQAAEGVVPDPITVVKGETVHFPANYTLYVEGKTMKYWMDADGNALQDGALNDDMTVYPYFEDNTVNLADRTEAVTVTFPLNGSQGNFNINNSGIIVTQATVNGEAIDVKADIKAGSLVSNNGGWHQVKNNFKATVPSCEGATVTISTYDDPTSLLSFNGQTAFSVEGSGHAWTASYTTTATDATMEIAQTGSTYWNNLAITLPVVQQSQPSTFRDIKVTLADADKWQALVANGATVYVTVAEDGTIGTTENADEAAATLTGKWHSTGYGWANFTADVPVEGCVKITYATHDFGNDITVTDDTGTQVAKFNTKGAKWSSDPSNVVVAYYRTNEPTTLHFSKADYNPYFAVEAIDPADLPELPTAITLTYYDTDGTTVIGTQEIDGQTEIGQFKYGAADVTVAEGKAFRGWFAAANGGKKYKTTDVPEGDLALYAVATDIEVAEPGKTFTWNLTNEFFYFEDHELISTIGSGYFHDGSHGWAFKNNDQIAVKVAGNATIKVTTCQYGATDGMINVVNTSGTTLESLPAMNSNADGTVVSYKYEGDATELSLTFSSSGETYIHAVSVENASAEEPGDEPHDPVTLVWDYTEKSIPTTGPDNGLYYASYVNDDDSNNHMHGVKLNSSGWAYFEKPAVAGKLTLTFGNRKTADAYTVNISNGTLNSDGKTATKGTPIGEITVAESPGTGSIELGADVTGIYIDRKTPAEGVLQKIVFKENVARQFKDFEIPYATLTKDGYTGAGLPEGVTFSGSFHDPQHGYSNAILSVPTDGGAVKFTISGCQYANPATFPVKNAAGETLTTLDQQAAGCYDAGGKITYIYNDAATTLTFGPIAYLSYFKAEAVDVQEVTITYKDQNGNKLGEKKVFEGELLGEIPYTEADLTIPEGEKFRGWVYNSGIKVKPTDIVSANVTVKASVTAIEKEPETGTIQTYDLAQATFYPEDHENFSVEGGSYYNNHGWTFDAGGKFEVAVSGKAQIVLTLCQYGSGTTFKVTDAQGNVIKDDVPAIAETDGSTTTVVYDGEATRLTFTCATQTYLHMVTVYNVENFIEKDEDSNYYIIPAGDAASLILAINAVSSEEGAKIFLPDGTYDLGETVKTTISGKNVSLIGQSAEKTIVVTTPPVAIEGLDKADLLKNKGEGLYIQDITLKNNMYYDDNTTGRAASLHDEGTKTICKNVNLLSHQDTYYSHKVGGLYYFEGGELHGTVDYLCGNGKVFFNECKIVNEKRNSATISANSELYVFNNCVVENNADKYNFGRAWSDHPVCIYLNTTLMDPSKLIATRWNPSGINCDYSIAGEFGTKNAEGTDITPEENMVTFTKENTTLNTILTADQAATYTMEYVLGDWAATAKQATAQLEAPAAELTNGTISWTPANNGAIAYMIEKNGEFVGITTESTFVVEPIANAPSLRAEAGNTDVYTIRAANAHGGFGEPKEVSVTATGINNAKNNMGDDTIYNMQGVRVEKAQKGVYIVNGKKVVIK